MICRIIQINHLIMIQRLWDDYGWYNWDNDLPYLHLDQTNIVNTLRLCRSKVDLFCLSFHLQGQIPWRGKRHTKLESNTVGVGHVGPLELSPTFSNYLELDLKWIELDLESPSGDGSDLDCDGNVLGVLPPVQHPASSTSTPRGLEPISQHPPHCRKPSRFTRNADVAHQKPVASMLQLQVQSSMMIKNGPPGSQGITIFLPTHTVRSDESQVLEKNYNAIGEDILHQAASECPQKNGLQIGVGASSVYFSSW